MAWGLVLLSLVNVSLWKHAVIILKIDALIFVEHSLKLSNYVAITIKYLRGFDNNENVNNNILYLVNRLTIIVHCVAYMPWAMLENLMLFDFVILLMEA